MNDLISRQDAIEAVAELASSMSVCISVDECHGMKRMQGMAVRALDDLPSVQPQSTMGQVNEAVQSTNDCISRQAAIDALDEIEAEVADGYGYQYAKWREYFVEMPSAQPKHTETHECVYQRTETHDWIPVTERLPDEWKRVLIQNDEGLFLVGFVKDRGWGKEWYYQYEMYDYDAYIESEQGKIVAWCELPDRWKGEEE